MLDVATVFSLFFAFMIIKIHFFLGLQFVCFSSTSMNIILFYSILFLVKPIDQNRHEEYHSVITEVIIKAMIVN